MKLEKFRGIWNCPTLSLPLLDYECSLSWNTLLRSDDPSVRDCPHCEKSVRLCSTPDEFLRASEKGLCVAIPDAIRPINLFGSLVGRPSPESTAAFKAASAHLVEWWAKVIRDRPQALGNELEPLRKAVDRQRDENSTSDGIVRFDPFAVEMDS